MAYEAKAIANLFLDIAQDNGVYIDPMKIQKLVYITHGWHLALADGHPLITDSIKAWKYGPVIPSLYHEFKNYGSGAITSKATELDLKEFQLLTPEVPKKDKTVRELADRIWEVYGELSGVQLSNLTHLKDTPWDITWKECEQGEIGNTLIKEHFSSLANN